MKRKVVRERKVEVLDRPVSRYRRHIVSGQLYEITMRVSRGLPFVQNETMNLLLQSAMAQACFISKVRVSHFLWMTNHVHILAVAGDPEGLTKFYGVLSKVVTDHLKRLLSIPRLRLWEGRVSVIRVLDPEAAVQRIAYFYANPAAAYLVGTITDYPGLSSFSQFSGLMGNNSVDAVDRKLVPWIRPRYIIPIQSRRISATLDRDLVAHLLSVAYYANNFEVAPNAWMKVFGISDADDVAKWNAKIFVALRDREAEAMVLAKNEGRKIIGARALRRARILDDFVPKKNGKRIFFIGGDSPGQVAALKRLGMKCDELYRRFARYGIPVRWPPGVFPPRAPVSACALVT